MTKILMQLFCFLLPWSWRRRVLSYFLGYEIDSAASVGLSFVLADELKMEANSRIGHFNYIGKLDRIHLELFAVIGNFNWVTGLSTRNGTPFYAKRSNRKSELHLKACGTITHQHYLDCTDKITIGAYSGLAGVRSQLITHGIDIITSRQTCAPISIGDYTMVGTGTLILKGVSIPDKCVVSAGSVVTHIKAEALSLIAGNPAAVTRQLPCTSKFFSRVGHVVY